jgi:predicted RNA-binding Zn-ribbon protein involved in translation (DUF1610 family)
MKRCSQCGKEVPDSAMVGQRCPRCGLTWQAERKDSYSYKKPKEKSGCTWWVIILIIIMAITTGLPYLVKSKIPINEDRIIDQWLSMNIDSVALSRQVIVKLKSPLCDSIFSKASKKYAREIEYENNQTRKKLISFVIQIDSVFSGGQLNFRVVYPNAMYKKLLDISSNPNLWQSSTQTADSTLQVLNLKR